MEYWTEISTEVKFIEVFGVWLFLNFCLRNFKFEVSFREFVWEDERAIVETERVRVSKFSQK